MNIVKQAYTDPAHDAYISNLSNELTTYAETQGRQNGSHNIPVCEYELRAHVMNYIESKGQTAIDYNQQKHQPVSGVVVSQKIQSDAKEKVKALTATLEEDEHKLRFLEYEKRRLAPDLKKRKIRICVYAGIVVISLAELIFAYEALRQAMFPKMAAFISATAIAVGVGFGMHVLAGFIRKAKTKLQKILRYSLAIIPAFIGFCILGHLRAGAYNDKANFQHAIDGTAITQTGVSGWGIAIISFLLFLIGLLLSIRFHKSDEEAKRDQEYDRVCGEINKLTSKMKATRNEISQIQVEANAKAAEALARFEYAVAVENRLKAIARQALEAYISANLRHRTDGLCPVFFSYPPAFNFRLFFDSVKNNNVKTA